MPSLDSYLLGNYALGGPPSPVLKQASGSLPTGTSEAHQFTISNLNFKPAIITVRVYLRIGSSYMADLRGYIYADEQRVSSPAIITYSGSEETSGGAGSSVNFTSVQFGGNSVTFTLGNRLVYDPSFSYTVYGI